MGILFSCRTMRRNSPKCGVTKNYGKYVETDGQLGVIDSDTGYEFLLQEATYFLFCLRTKISLL